jgi:L-lactate dehydrogenase complex protein LldF
MAINDPVLQASLANLQQRLGQGAADGYQRFPEGPELRLKGHDIRMNAIDNLDILLAALADKIEQNGGHVHFAPDARAAVDHCIAIARRHDVSMAVKGKSMLTEEIGLNPALEAAGIETVETDLGEYIVQLAGEAPSHIIAPAIHKSREAVGRLFSDKLDIPYTDDPPTLDACRQAGAAQKIPAGGFGHFGMQPRMCRNGTYHHPFQ